MLFVPSWLILNPQMPNDVRQLDDALSEPTEKLIDSYQNHFGDLLILGAGGKMGPNFSLMSRRAIDSFGKHSLVLAVSRFTNDKLARDLAAHGVEIISGDLFDAEFVANLPDAENILYLVGMKFGTDVDAARTWASNTYIAGLVADRFHTSRVVVLSTGNVYGLVPVDHGHGRDRTISAGARWRIFRQRDRPRAHFRILQPRARHTHCNHSPELRHRAPLRRPRRPRPTKSSATNRSRSRPVTSTPSGSKTHATSSSARSSTSRARRSC